VIALVRDNVSQADELPGDVWYTWKTLLSFSFVENLIMIMRVAPILWFLLTEAAIGKKQAAQLEAANVHVVPGAGAGRGNNNHRNLWIVSPQPSSVAHQVNEPFHRLVSLWSKSWY
jgi:hypothetical protein